MSERTELAWMQEDTARRCEEIWGFQWQQTVSEYLTDNQDYLNNELYWESLDDEQRDSHFKAILDLMQNSSTEENDDGTQDGNQEASHEAAVEADLNRWGIMDIPLEEINISEAELSNLGESLD